MTKSVLKEIIIVLLLCLAIILVLGIILYEYVPISKTVPSPVAYTTPEEVQQELIAAGNLDESQVMMTYEVNSDDLNNFKRVQNYKPGKANPFSSFEAEVTGEGEGNTTSSNTTATSGNASSGNGTTQGGENNGNEGSTTSGGGNSSQGNSGGSSSSGGQFFQDKGTK